MSYIRQKFSAVESLTSVKLLPLSHSWFRHHRTVRSSTAQIEWLHIYKTCRQCVALNKFPFEAVAVNNLWDPVENKCYESTTVITAGMAGIMNARHCSHPEIEARVRQDIQALQDASTKAKITSAFLREKNDMIKYTLQTCEDCTAFNEISEDHDTAAYGVGIWNNCWSAVTQQCLPSRAKSIMGVPCQVSPVECLSNSVQSELAFMKPGIVETFAGADVQSIDVLSNCESCVKGNLIGVAGQDISLWNNAFDLVSGNCFCSMAITPLPLSAYVLKQSQCPLPAQIEFAAATLVRLDRDETRIKEMRLTCKSCLVFNVPTDVGSKKEYHISSWNMAWDAHGIDGNNTDTKCFFSNNPIFKTEPKYYILDPALCERVALHPFTVQRQGYEYTGNLTYGHNGDDDDDYETETPGKWTQRVAF